jgi:DNA-binding Lrp family transcriptional regulator
MPHLDLIHKAPDSPADNKGPVPGESPAANEGPAQIEPLALHEVGPASGIGPASSTGPKREFSLLNSLPDVKGYMLWFHQVTDYLDRQLTPFEQCLYKQLYRLSWGFDQATCIIGFPKLAERTNMSETAARQAAKGLVRKGLVKKRGMVFGKGVEQGIEWEVFSPPALTKHKEDNRGRAARNTGPSINAGQVSKAGPSLSAPIKEINTQKETTQTQSGVGVSSRFKLEECRRYANHLKETGQGITNPGGYATRIFRSGEADTLIEAFLNPQAPLDINQCLECRGTNFIYIDPTDHDKGVRPCRHESLRSLAK